MSRATLNPNDFRLFLEVAELGSFTRASIVLDIALGFLAAHFRKAG